MNGIVLTVATLAFVVSGSIGLARLLRGPSLIDRVAALDVALVSLMGVVTLEAVRHGSTVALDLLVIVAVVGFTTTVAASRYVELTRVDATDRQERQEEGR